METGSNFSDDEAQRLHWMEDFNDFSVDELRELLREIMSRIDLEAAVKVLKKLGQVRSGSDIR